MVSLTRLQNRKSSVQRNFHYQLSTSKRSMTFANTFTPPKSPLTYCVTLFALIPIRGGVVLDNCIGSGTTAIACIKEKRHYIGFELNKDYFDKAEKRIWEEKRQLTLF